VIKFATGEVAQGRWQNGVLIEPESAPVTDTTAPTPTEQSTNPQ